MENGWRTQARRVLLQQVAPIYHQASEPQRQEILEQFVADTGYARKYVESQLPFASNGDYFGRNRLPGKIPEKLNKKRQLRRYDPTITA